MSNDTQPEIRFPGFTEDWEQHKLIEVARYRNGKAHEQAIDESGKYIVVNSKFVSTNGRVKKYTNIIIDPLKKNELAFVLSDVPNGKAIARTFLVDKEHRYSLNQRIAGITPHKDTDSYFLNVLMNRNPYFLKFDNGVGQTNLTKADVENFIGHYPSYEEQQKIGTFFKQLDDTIALQQRKLDLLKETKKGFLQKMFPKNGAKVPEIRFPGFTEDWEQRKLSEMAGFSKGNGYSKADLVEKGHPVILYGRLYTKYETVIEKVDTFAELKEKSVISNGGEVIVPASGETPEDISRASVVDVSGVALGGDLNIIKTKSELDPTFLALTISNGSQQKEMTKRAQGKSVVHLHNSDLKEVNLLYPKLDEQVKIGSFFKKLDVAITLHQRKLDLLKETKKGFLQKMFV
ncbi:restriction endonuclease subunit S [Enterococcus lactis]|nr:restriction endonuclease subunit S [Enterococcus lactis]